MVTARRGWSVSCASGPGRCAIVALVFFDTLRRHAGADPDYLRSGASSYGSYLVDDTVGGWLYGSAFFLVIGAGLGSLGGIVGRWRGPQRASV